MKKSKWMAGLLFTLILGLALQANAQSQRGQSQQAAKGQMGSPLSLEEGLLGKSIRTQNGEDVGEIEDVIFSRRGKVSHVLVDIGGFLGIGEKTVALNLNQLKLSDQDFALFTGTRNDLENMPEVDRYAFRRSYRGYYGPYGGYGPYGYGPYRPYYGYQPYGRGMGYGPYDRGAMQDQMQDQMQDRMREQGRERGERQYRDSGRGMMQDRMMRRGQMHGNRGMSGDFLVGSQVVNQWNENLGEVSDLVLDPSTGRITHAVIEVGGFWDVGDKHVAVPYNQLRQVGPYTMLFRGTEEQLEQMPDYQKGEGGIVLGLGQETQKAGGQGSGTQRRSDQPQYQQRRGGSQQ